MNPNSFEKECGPAGTRTRDFRLAKPTTRGEPQRSGNSRSSEVKKLPKTGGGRDA